jgi:hypothetical protein
MEGKIIEALGGGCWSKFLVARFGPDEWTHRSAIKGFESLILGAHDPRCLLVLDLETNEGALFSPHGNVRSDLRKHQIWISVLFQPFLVWLYEQAKVPDFDPSTLPDIIEVEGPGAAGRQDGPLNALLKKCLKSDDKETRAMARTVWTGIHGEEMPLGTPPTLAEFQRLMGESPDASIALTS